MRRLLAAAVFLIPFDLSAAEVARVGPYSFHSSFWVSLHQTLMHFATTKSAVDLTGLTAEERQEWKAAVDIYKANNPGGMITFERPMRITHDVLTAVADDVTATSLRDPLGPALLKAAPIYRRRFWSADDRANRFWIAYASAMVRDAGDEIAAAHAKAYGLPWPEAVRVDAAPYAVPFGAYTMMGQLAGVHETIATRDEGNSGLTALEVVHHEASHALVDPNNGPVAEAIRKHAERLGIKQPPDLWHAILFSTSSELTRRALAARGLKNYVGNDDDLYKRVWPRYREPIEKFWIAHLDGKLTLDEAIGKIVEAVPTPRP